MPVYDDNGTTVVVLGVGDVAMMQAEVRPSRDQYLTIAPMDRTMEIGGNEKPTVADAIMNGVKVLLTSTSRQGWDNLIDIIRELRDAMPEEDKPTTEEGE